MTGTKPLQVQFHNSLRSRLPDAKNRNKVFLYTGIKTTIMRLSSEQHRALGTFLRARRDTLSPGDVGLHPPPGCRRAKGLRREEAARHLFAGWLDGKERNLLRYVFLAPDARTFLDDWESSARRVLAEFRAVSIRGDTEQVDALVQELRSLIPDFERLWHNQSVLLREGGPRKFDHLIDGRVDFDQTILTFTTWSQYQLVALKPR